MASSDYPYHYRREPVENGTDDTFDLFHYVMSEAAALPYYWPEHNAEMTQLVLQEPSVEDGTYILRPSGKTDVLKRKLLTLSIRMDFPKETTKVWHFPVIIGVENADPNPVVHFSLTQTSNTSSNHITSLAGLLEYHHQRPLKGGKLPHICKVIKGLNFQSKKSDEKKKSDAHKHLISRVVYELNPVEFEDRVDPMSLHPISESLPPISAPITPIAPIRSGATLQATQSQRERRPQSPQPPPRSRTLPNKPKVPQPAPRKASTPFTPSTPSTPDPRINQTDVFTPAPINPRPQHMISISDTSSTSSGDSIDGDDKYDNASSESNKHNSVSSEDSSKFCQCGLPLEVTHLPKFWTVHRSTSADTLHMLYFRNPAGQTAWALPPYIDRECPNRNYLNYGRLNVTCFQQYASEMNYSSSSELSNWTNYSTYNQRN